MGQSEIQIHSNSDSETRRIGETLGRCISTGIVVALTGNLGSGKTAFVQGLAKGLEVSEKYYITSPTYTIVNEYPGRLPLFHVDLYRLDGGNDFENIGLYDMTNIHQVVAVEWAEKMGDEKFPEMMYVNIAIEANDTRTISMEAHGTGSVTVMRLFKAELQENK